MTHRDADQPTDPVTEPIVLAGPTAPRPPVVAAGGRLDALRTHLAFAVVLLVAAAGIVRILEYHWRQGSALIGGTLVLAALFRALLPPRRAGLLAVRGRPVDVLSYAGLGALVLFVALTIQGGPFG